MTVGEHAGDEHSGCASRLHLEHAVAEDGHVEIPETRYVHNGDIAIAYSITGEGPIDLVYVPGYISHVDYVWEGERSARFLRRLSSFSRLLLVDRRGTGLSDRLSPNDLPPLEIQMEDLLQVLDAVGSERPALFGFEAGAMLCAVFAATFPERTLATVLYSTAACGIRRPDYPWQWSEEEYRVYLERLWNGWGTQAYADEILRWAAPSLADDQGTRAWWARLQRLAASPSSALALERMWTHTDIRSALGSIQAPTLVAHRTGDAVEDIDAGRDVASRIPGARFVELPGIDCPPWGDDQDALLDAVEEFLTGAKHGPETDRVLATVLLTDIVGSTRKAAEVGDTAWKEMISTHDRRARTAIERFRGRYVNTTGDGMLATFDGPARAVRCARAIGEAVGDLDLEIRAGCHTGEVEVTGEGTHGIAVHIGARVAALAGPSEVLVSSTVKDLVAGSGLTFEDAGEHELKGVPDRWHLYRVTS
jgi:class 3 adenylate cyclase